jgi:hypothetical protein
MGETYSVILTKFRAIEPIPSHPTDDPNISNRLALRFDSTDGGQVVLQVTPSALRELAEELQRYGRVPGFQ